MPLKTNKLIKKNSITPPNEDIELNKKEIQFLLTKMKTAQFTGAEFEQFYSIFTKLSKQLKK